MKSGRDSDRVVLPERASEAGTGTDGSGAG